MEVSIAASGVRKVIPSRARDGRIITLHDLSALDV